VKTWRYLTASLLLLLLLLPLVTSPASQVAHAASTPSPEKGLLITPVRQYLSGDAGKTVESTLTIANLTEQSLVVSLSVQQFSVTNYVYDYKFTKTPEDWVHLSTNSVTLKPDQTQHIPYLVRIPAGSAPGGHYYTLFASANLQSQGINSTIQAADLLYLTVNGKLTTVSHLEDSSIQWVSFGHDISFSLKPVNTGNVHSFVYVSGELHGLFVPPPMTSGAHLLMPGKVRSLQDKIPAPVLPGFYKATYGYKTESGWVIQKSHLVLFIPPWFIAFLLAGFLIVGKFWQRKKHTNTSGTPTKDTDT
jgi:hypothetical protein